MKTHTLLQLPILFHSGDIVLNRLYCIQLLRPIVTLKSAKFEHLGGIFKRVNAVIRRPKLSILSCNIFI